MKDSITKPDSLGLIYRIGRDGNIDIVGRRKRTLPRSTPFQLLMRLRRQLKAEGFTVTKSDCAKGYQVSRPAYHWTEFTVYLNGNETGFSLYEALPDIHKGIDIEDEKLVGKNLAPSKAVAIMLETEARWKLPEWYDAQNCLPDSEDGGFYKI